MTTRSLLTGLLGIFLAAAIPGCTTTTQPAEDELSIMREMIETSPLFTNDEALFFDADQLSLAKTTAPIIPLAWGRRVDNASRSVTFDRSGDTVVVATIVFSMSGEILIAHRDTVQDTTLIAEKPFAESITRKVRFTRVARTDHPRQNWKMREVSGADGGTTSSASISFTELKAIAGDDTLTVTDPTEFFIRFPAFAGRRMYALHDGTSLTVRLTLTSTEADTDMVFIHRPFQWLNSSILRPARIRMSLVSEAGSGPYTRVYEYSWTSHIPGSHHFFVSGITRSSLFDDSAPWSTKIWGVPYLVVP